MCLAIPGLVEDTFFENDMYLATVNFSGVKRRICLTYTPEAKKGDYVLVHVGFALTVVNENEAEETLKALAAMGENKLD
ncbi:HypC/HybG/HupF family hydrogenase formation chaperone [bacterium]|nr:HypC/HybG/HupF family hydrogenase formation chaperone [bacterium]